MSNLEATVETECGGTGMSLEPALEVLTPRPVLLGPHQEVRRVLPNRDRRMIGAWCFVDHYGPEDITAERGMWVPPHPHAGLQTVSWLFDGEIRHRDSLGSDVLVRPGDMNLMTAGAGIAHSEESPAEHSPVLHGLQLWVALPSPARTDVRRDFTQYRDLPAVSLPGLSITVVVGELAGGASEVTSYSPLVGAEIVVNGEGELPLRADFEYGVLAVDGRLSVDDVGLERSSIAYLGGGRTSIRLTGSGRVFLLGGEPFEEQLVMWWNFIARSHDEIVEMRRDWNEGGADRYGVVHGFAGDRLIAPPMPTAPLKPRGRNRFG